MWVHSIILIAKLDIFVKCFSHAGEKYYFILGALPGLHRLVSQTLIPDSFQNFGSQAMLCFLPEQSHSCNFKVWTLHKPVCA